MERIIPARARREQMAPHDTGIAIDEILRRRGCGTSIREVSLHRKRTGIPVALLAAAPVAVAQDQETVITANKSLLH
jgi:hypothetical protein